MTKPVVWLLHAVDTEGPLYESPEETVIRINGICGLSLPPTRQTLADLRAGTVDLGSSREVVNTLLKHSSFLGDWGDVQRMLDRVGSAEFRSQNSDSFGRGWLYNFHVMDHVGYDVNPRRRDIGFHNIFDAYRNWIRDTGSDDELGFHFHPDHFYKHAHLCGTGYDPAEWLHRILSRRLIDRSWFPRSFRAGFHTERPDANAFLEQWIPHDFSNQSMATQESTAGQLDVDQHRFGDWTRAPLRWGWYHPHHDDYQAEGNCRRRIFRCLNINARLRSIDRAEVERAFNQVRETGDSVWVMVTNHDFRDMEPDVRWLKETFDVVSRETDIKWRIGTISDTFEPWRGPPTKSSFRLESSAIGVRLHIEYDEPIFGPQPYLALKLVNETYLRQNTDIITPFRRFSYTFDEHSIPLAKVEKIVAGTNDRHGNIIIHRIKE